MITPPEKVATPIVKGGAAGAQNRLGPLKDSKSIVVVAAVAFPTPTTSAKLAVTSASQAMRARIITILLPPEPAYPTGLDVGAETSSIGTGASKLHLAPGARAAYADATSDLPQ